MELIRSELRARGIALSEEVCPTVLRCIHTSADFDYAENLVFSPGVVPKITEILSTQNPVIVTDTNMALSGISSRACGALGVEKVCFMADEDVAGAAALSGLTRAACAVDKAAGLFQGRAVVFAVGNAPTALVRMRQLFDAGIFRPAAVVGVPVGFVNVVRAKELIMESGLDFVVARGKKGGSSIAAAIVNSFLYQV